MDRNVVGAQLYTLRDFCKTINDIRTTMKKVADIGYTAIQVSGFGPVKPSEVADAAREAGLRIAATHEDWRRFLTDLDAVIEEHKLWECNHLAVGMLPKEYYSLDGMKRFADELPPVAEKLASEGMDFSYHNHSHEFALYNGRTWLEQLYEMTEPRYLKAEIDTYWVQHGGGDPAAWIRKYSGRLPLLHLKDMTITPEREQRYAEIGEGNLNWDEILSAAAEAEVEWYLVEQDECYGRDPFESMEISYRNLCEMGLS